MIVQAQSLRGVTGNPRRKTLRQNDLVCDGSTPPHTQPIPKRKQDGEAENE